MPLCDQVVFVNRVVVSHKKSPKVYVKAILTTSFQITARKFKSLWVILSLKASMHFCYKVFFGVLALFWQSNWLIKFFILLSVISIHLAAQQIARIGQFLW